MNKRLSFALSLLALSAPMFAHSQAIQISNEAFPVAPATQSLPFAPKAAELPLLPVAPVAPVAAAVAVPAIQAAPVAPAFEVLSTDKTVREVLARWASASGWIHEAAHWTIDKDHPIQGTAGADVFGKDFKQAVRVLLSSTELTDRPVQPCFYTNNVVRVVPITGMCDR